MTSSDPNPAVAVTRLEGRGPLNLLGPQAFFHLRSELDRLDQDRSVKAMVLTGSGDRAFSAGVDLYQMKDLNPEDDPGILELFSTERFIPIDNGNYRAIEEVARELGIIK